MHQSGPPLGSDARENKKDPASHTHGADKKTPSLTDYNVAISVVSLFVLIAKLIAFIMRVWPPVTGLFFSLTMSILYIVSVYGQMGPDYYDADHPSPMAWYIRYGCWPAVNFPNKALSSCHMAVGTFAVTVYQL